MSVCICAVRGRARVLVSTCAPLSRPRYKGPAQVTRWVSHYGITVSFWGSGTLKIVIPIENHPQEREVFGWLIITPLGGGVNYRTKYV